MRAKGLYITIGVCGSLFLHGLLVWVLISLVVGQAIGDALWAMGRVIDDPQGRSAVAVNSKLAEVAPPAVAPPSKPKDEVLPAPNPLIAPPTPVVPAELPKPEPLPAPEPVKAQPPPPPPVLADPQEPPPPPPAIAKLPPPEPVIKPVPPPPPPEVVKVEPPPPPPPEIAKVDPPAPPPVKIEPPPPAKVEPPPELAEKPPALPPPLPKPPPPPPLVKVDPPKPPDDDNVDAIDVDHIFGQQDGKGKAVNSSPEKGQQQARKGEQDQAALARSLEGVVKPLPLIDFLTGRKAPGGGPAGGGGGAVPQPVAKPSDQTVAMAGAGGIPGPLTPVQPPEAQTRAQVSRGPDRVEPDKADAAVRTGPDGGGNPLAGQDAKSPGIIGLGAQKFDKIGDKAQEGVAAVKAGAGGNSGSGGGPEAGPKPEEIGPAAPKVAAALGKEVRPALGQGAGDVPLNLPTTRPTEPQYAMAIGPKDLPPGKKNPVEGPPGPGDGTGEGDPPSRSPIKDPASISESESDAFSTMAAEMFVRGGVQAKAGRKVQTVKPRLGEHSMMDMATVGRVVTVFRVSVNKDGRVTDVQVRRPSGSDSIDLETSLALYRWWIEPKKGPDGLPVEDVISLTIVWH